MEKIKDDALLFPPGADAFPSHPTPSAHISIINGSNKLSIILSAVVDLLQRVRLLDTHGLQNRDDELLAVVEAGANFVG